MGPGAFSADYLSSRARFRASAGARGARLEAHPIDAPGPGGEPLTIDVAHLGDDRPSRLLIVSSGLHGVEGPFGAAVQAALLEQELVGWSPPSGAGLLLIHALDPWGFAHSRRFNESGIDLNRNFLPPGEPYRGSPDGYADLDSLLNPRRPPSRLDPLWPRALLAIARQGLARLKQVVAGGQYDFPLGLFFGGHGPSATHRILEAHLPRWVGDAEVVLHIDFHTGLGRWGDDALLIEPGLAAERVARLGRHFPNGRVLGGEPDGIAYPTRGGLETWCRRRFADREYDLLCAEFGTYPVLHVLAALRAENQAHHWGDPGDPATLRARSRLREAFVPASTRWRDRAVARGLEIVRRAMGAAYRRGS